MTDQIVVEIPEPTEQKPSDNGPRLNWLGAVFLGIAALGIGSCFFLPVTLVWIGVLVGCVGAATLIFWAVLKK